MASRWGRSKQRWIESNHGRRIFFLPFRWGWRGRCASAAFAWWNGRPAATRRPAWAASSTSASTRSCASCCSTASTRSPSCPAGRKKRVAHALQRVSFQRGHVPPDSATIPVSLDSNAKENKETSTSENSPRSQQRRWREIDGGGGGIWRTKRWSRAERDTNSSPSLSGGYGWCSCIFHHVKVVVQNEENVWPKDRCRSRSDPDVSGGMAACRWPMPSRRCRSLLL